MKTFRLAPLLIVLALLMGCATQPISLSEIDIQSNTGAAEESAMLTPKNSLPSTKYEVRKGIHSTTLATPLDVPSAYNYGTGVYYDFSYSNNEKKLPIPNKNEIVLNTAPDISRIQALYLWEEGNVPATTTFTDTMTGYFDNHDFCPYVTAIPVREGAQIKGAVVLMAGGAFSFRGNYTDTLPTAMHLRELGYQTFIVDYRLRPYTQQEGALDVARASCEATPIFMVLTPIALR